MYRAADNNKFESNKVSEKISKPHKVSPSKYKSSPSSSVDSISDEEEEDEEKYEEEYEIENENSVEKTGRAGRALGLSSGSPPNNNSETSVSYKTESFDEDIVEEEVIEEIEENEDDEKQSDNSGSVDYNSYSENWANDDEEYDQDYEQDFDMSKSMLSASSVFRKNNKNNNKASSGKLKTNPLLKLKEDHPAAGLIKLANSLSAQQEDNLERMEEAKQLDEKTATFVDNWRNILQEPLAKELELLDTEADIAEDSFASLEVPVISSNTQSSSAGMLSTSIAIISIQKVARGFISRKYCDKLKLSKFKARVDIQNTLASGSLVDVYDKAEFMEKEILEDSFARLD